MTQHQTPVENLKAEGVCPTRLDLLNRLAGAVELLGRAKLDLTICLENDAWTPGFFTKGEVEQLRHECGSIRAELEFHRARHGC